MDFLSQSDEQLIIDQSYMRKALNEAEHAERLGEVPVGAIFVQQNGLITAAHNLRETTGDPTAHAEIIVLRKAAELQKHWRLSGTLYVTLEPCPMCAGAMLQARITRLVYGAFDPKAGAAGTLMNLLQDKRLNHWIEVTGGVLEEECAAILKRFFRERR